MKLNKLLCGVALALSSSALLATDLTAEQSAELHAALNANYELKSNPLLDHMNQTKADMYNVPIQDIEQRSTTGKKLNAVLSVVLDVMEDRLTGWWIVDNAEYGVYIQLKGDEAIPSEIQTIIDDNSLPIIFKTGSKYNNKELKVRIAEIKSKLILNGNKNILGVGSYPNGKIVIQVYNEQENKSKNKQISVERFSVDQDIKNQLDGDESIEILFSDSPTIDSDAAHVEFIGGSNLIGCTVGFNIRLGDIEGFITAGHCADTYDGGPQIYQDPKYPSIARYVANGGQIYNHYTDIQFHFGYDQFEPNPVDTYGYPPYMYIGSETPSTFIARTNVRSAIPRAQQNISDRVCHYGRTTGWSCGDIVSKEYAPSISVENQYFPCGVNSEGEPVECLPLWIQVKNTGTLKCQGGDSGGPFVHEQHAVGILKGCTYDSNGNTLFAFYTSVDYFNGVEVISIIE